MKRYTFENILLTELCSGQLKPNIKLFLANFISELSSLDKGCEFEDGNGKLIPSICRIQSVVPDLPTLAVALAHIQGDLTTSFMQGYLNVLLCIKRLLKQHMIPEDLQK